MRLSLPICLLSGGGSGNLCLVFGSFVYLSPHVCACKCVFYAGVMSGWREMKKENGSWRKVTCTTSRTHKYVLNYTKDDQSACPNVRYKRNWYE